MPAHAKIVVTAPHRNASLEGQRLGVVVRHRELRRPAVHRFKHAVRVILLLILDLLLEELVVAKVGDGWKRTASVKLAFQNRKWFAVGVSSL